MTSNIFKVVILIFFFTFSYCYGQKVSIKKKSRIEKLKNVQSNDPFLIYFLKYIKENKLEEQLIDYEDFLIKEHLLKDYSDVSLRNYLRILSEETLENRCTDKSILNKIHPKMKNFFQEVYNKYKEKKDKKLTTEFIYWQILENTGSLDPTVALPYALEHNKITLENRYFYLLTTMTRRVCDSIIIARPQSN